MSNYKYYLHVLTTNRIPDESYKDTLNMNDESIKEIFGNAHNWKDELSFDFKNNNGLKTSIICNETTFYYDKDNNKINLENVNLIDVFRESKYVIIKENIINNNNNNNIENFNRYLYYFISDRRIINNTTVEFLLKLDVFTSYFNKFYETMKSTNINVLRYHPYRYSYNENNVKYIDTSKIFYKQSEEIQVIKDELSYEVLKSSHNDIIDKWGRDIILYLYYFERPEQEAENKYLQVIRCIPFRVDVGSSVPKFKKLTYTCKRYPSEVTIYDNVDVDENFIYSFLVKTRRTAVNHFITTENPHTIYGGDLSGFDINYDEESDSVNIVLTIPEDSAIKNKLNLENYYIIDYNSVNLDLLNDDDDIEPKIKVNGDFTSYIIANGDNKEEFYLTSKYLLEHNYSSAYNEKLNFSKSISLGRESDYTLYFNRFEPVLCNKLKGKEDYGFNVIQSYIDEMEANEPGYYGFKKLMLALEKLLSFLNMFDEITSALNNICESIKEGNALNKAQSITNALSTGINIYGSYKGLEHKQRQIEYETKLLGNSISTGINFYDHLSTYHTLNPILFKHTINSDEIKVVNDYLKKFGYKTNEILTLEQCFTREHFTYLQTNINYNMFKSLLDLPNYVIEIIISVLNEGTRIWTSNLFLNENAYKINNEKSRN